MGEKEVVSEWEDGGLYGRVPKSEVKGILSRARHMVSV